MRTNETELKLRRFEVNEKRERIADVEAMILDFQRLADDLAHQIQVEEQTSRISDINHFSYSTYAKAARQRRENLLASIAELDAKLEEARADLAESLEELKKSELVEERTLIAHERTPARLAGLEKDSGPQGTQIHSGRA